jgi:hypothetical protein
MSPSELELAAIQINNYLKDSGAVRVSETEIADYRTVEQICDDLRICDGDFRRIKSYMRKRGVPISYVQNKGHFIGWEGEQDVETVYKYKVSRGHARNLGKYAREIQDASPAGREWINRRFKDFAIDAEEVRYANQYELP